MKKLNILYSNIKTDGNELAFIFPLIFNKKRLKTNHSIDLAFFDDHKPEKIFECDTMLISSWYFGRKTKSWIKDENEIFEFLKLAKSKGIKVIWCDISDSTGTTQFKVLPYVDVYTKGQLLKDKSQYQKEYYSGRIFGDFYHQMGIEDDIVTEKHLVFPLDKNFDKKLTLGWNSGFATYSHYGPYYNFYNYKYFNLKLPISYPLEWTKAHSKREIPISCRIGAGYKRKTMRYQREQVKKLLKDVTETKKIGRKEYFSEMRNTVVNVSPFGLGEISLRDFEVVVSGGTIMKANCSHMSTFPNLFIEGETYLDYHWDLSDFREKIDYALSNLSEMKDRAENCQGIYKELLTTETGYEKYCEHLNGILSH